MEDEGEGWREGGEGREGKRREEKERKGKERERKGKGKERERKGKGKERERKEKGSKTVEFARVLIKNAVDAIPHRPLPSLLPSLTRIKLLQP